MNSRSAVFLCTAVFLLAGCAPHSPIDVKKAGARISDHNGSSPSPCGFRWDLLSPSVARCPACHNCIASSHPSASSPPSACRAHHTPACSAARPGRSWTLTAAGCCSHSAPSSRPVPSPPSPAPMPCAGCTPSAVLPRLSAPSVCLLGQTRCTSRCRRLTPSSPPVSGHLHLPCAALPAVPGCLVITT